MLQFCNSQSHPIQDLLGQTFLTHKILSFVLYWLILKITVLVWENFQFVADFKKTIQVEAKPVKKFYFVHTVGEPRGGPAFWPTFSLNELIHSDTRLKPILNHGTNRKPKVSQNTNYY